MSRLRVVLGDERLVDSRELHVLWEHRVIGRSCRWKEVVHNRRLVVLGVIQRAFCESTEDVVVDDLTRPLVRWPGQLTVDQLRVPLDGGERSLMLVNQPER